MGRWLLLLALLPAPAALAKELGPEEVDRAARLVKRLLDEAGGERLQLMRASAPYATFAPPGPWAGAVPPLPGFVRGWFVRSDDVAVTIGVCEDADAARRNLEVVLASMRAKDRADDLSGFRVLSATYERVDLDVAEAELVERCYTVGLGTVRTQVVAGVSGRLYFDVVQLHSGSRESALRRARRALVLVRARERPSPWAGRTGPEAAAAFRDALGHADWTIRWRAIRNLRRLGAASEPALLDALADPAPDVRVEALRALFALGGLDELPLERQAALQEDDDWEVRLEYFRARLADDGLSEEERARLLLLGVVDASPDVRFAALDSLGRKDGQQIPIAAAERLLADPDLRVRREASGRLLFGLVSRTRRDPEARDRTLRILLEVSEDADSQVRQQGMRHLGWLGIPSDECIAALRRGLADDDLFVRWWTMQSIGQLGPDAQALVPDLTGLLPDLRCRTEAAEALGHLGPPAHAAADGLRAGLAEADLEFRFECGRALWRLDLWDDRIPAAAGEFLRRGPEYQRGEAAEMLGELGSAAEPYLADLEKAEKEGDVWLSASARKALDRLRDRDLGDR